MKLLSVILADDDQLVLQDLVTLVKWNKLGFEIKATANNGITALEIIDKYRPDLLITDISMPGLNGLDLIEKVHKEYPHMKILIITSYDEFDYAKRALQNGVMDYILKTEITSATLSQKLTEIFVSHQNENQFTTNLLSQELTVYFSSPESVLNSDLLPNVCRNSSVNWHFGVVAKNQMFARDYNHAMSDITFDTSKLLNQIRQYSVNSWMMPLLFTHGPYIIYAFSMEGTKKQDRHSFVSFATRLHYWLSNSTGKAYMHCYSSSGMTFSHFREVFLTLRPLLSYYSLFCPEKPLDIKTFKKEYVISSLISFPFQKLIFTPDQLENDMLFIKQFITRCCENYDCESIIQFYTGFCSYIETLTCGQLTLQDDVYAPSPEHLLKWLFHCCEQCCHVLQYGQTRQYSAAVNSAISYIKQNYSDFKLTAEQISLEVGLSPGRLGVIFKQDTGITLNEYLTSFRVEKAIALLSNTNMKIYEISEKCGYKSSQYFSQIIYNNTGKRPLDFRKAASGSNHEKGL